MTDENTTKMTWWSADIVKLWVTGEQYKRKETITMLWFKGINRTASIVLCCYSGWLLALCVCVGTIFTGQGRVILTLCNFHWTPNSVCFRLMNLMVAVAGETGTTHSAVIYINYTCTHSWNGRLLRVCGRFGPAGYVWGCRGLLGPGTSPGLVIEFSPGQRYSVPQNIPSLLSTGEKKIEGYAVNRLLSFLSQDSH